MGDGSGETVYTTPRQRVYHTDRDCLHLQRSPTVRKVSVDDLVEETTKCKRCDGYSAPNSGGDGGKLARKLEAMDPDDVG